MPPHFEHSASVCRTARGQPVTTPKKGKKGGMSGCVYWNRRSDCANIVTPHRPLDLIWAFSLRAARAQFDPNDRTEKLTYETYKPTYK